ncbi:MAG: HutD family protein [Chitinophagaceae bacterium]|nr:HutD family protein [Oligoflexus sp.]
MPNQLIHQTLSDYKVMPWKNGGGSTTELAIFPRNARIDEPFQWRLSLAQLDGSGPFSTFPGYDRIITQLSGSPMILVHEGQSSIALNKNTPYPFRGEWQTEGRLEGRAQDFNVMVNRDHFRAELDVMTVRDRLTICPSPSGTTYLWLAEGIATAVYEDQTFHLKTQDSLHLEQSEGDPVVIVSHSATLFQITLEPLQR